MKGQYFSFDAIIATVIMVLAFSSLVAYWYGAQAVVESRTYSRLADANRIAESLLSPGSPSNWDSRPITEVKQIGIATSFGNELNLSKVDQLAAYAAPAGGDYDSVGSLLRAGGDYYILIQRTDDNSWFRAIGDNSYGSLDAKYVVVASRGVTFKDAAGSHPASMRVFLWKR